MAKINYALRRELAWKEAVRNRILSGYMIHTKSWEPEDEAFIDLLMSINKSKEKNAKSL